MKNSVLLLKHHIQMKFKIFFLSTLLITNYCFAQTYFELSIGLSNQTQIRKVFDDFYLNNLKITTKTNLYSAGTTNATDLKYLIHTGIIFNKNYKIQLGIGIGQIKNEIKGDSTSVTNGPFIHEEYSQHITEWNLSLSRVIYFDKFSQHLSKFNLTNEQTTVINRTDSHR